MFHLVVTARGKSRAEQSITAGWYAAAFTRAKELKPLTHYLQTPEERRVLGRGAVVEMFQRLKAKQGDAHGTG